MNAAKKRFLQVFKRVVPARLEPACWGLLVKGRRLGWTARAMVPSGVLRRMPGTSRDFGPPRRLAHVIENAAGLLQGTVLHAERSFAYAPDPACVIPPVEEFVRPAASGSPVTKLAVLQNARIFGVNGTVIDCSDAFVTEMSPEHARCGPPETALRHSIFTSWKLAAPRVVKGVAMSMLSPGADNYFHWLFDVLPRFQALQDAGIAPSSVDWWIIPGPVLEFHRQTLSLLGIREDQCLPCAIGQGVEAEKLICVTPGMSGGSPPPWVMSFLSKLNADHGVLPSGVKAPLKLYLTRKRAPFRRVLNEDEVEAHLKAKGFTMIASEDYRFTEQMALFHAADVVVAPHGAGLANIAFCKPGTRVVELFPGSYLNRVYAETAGAAGLDYRCVIDMRVGGNAGNLAADLLVNLADLDQALTLSL